MATFLSNDVLEHAAHLIEARLYVQSCNALRQAALLAGKFALFETTVTAYKARYGKAAWWDTSYLDRTPESQMARMQALRSMKT
jgi:hypothetical protein